MNMLKNFLYGFLDVITGKKGVSRNINGMAIRFPAKWSRYYENDYEKDNYTFLQRQAKPGMQLIDIGAHIGLFSATASQLVGPTGKIVCFEPTPGTYAVLKETLRLNKCNNVVPVQAAVSEKEGEATFYVSHTAACNSNSLVKNREEDALIACPVKLTTIDNIVNEHSLTPSLIKIDAEGAELDVLKGGLQTFKKQKPVLILGLHPDFISKKGDSLEEIWDLLEENKYELKLEDKVLTRSQFCSNTLFFDVHCF